MRIAFDAKRAFHNNSGLGNYSRNIINRMASLYPENEYFLYDPKPGGSYQGFPPAAAILRTPQKALHKQFPFLWRSWVIPRGLSHDKIQIYHGLSNELPFGIHKFPGKKVVSIHDLIFFRYPHLYRTADRLIYTYKFRHSVDAADKIIAISEQTKRDIVHYLHADPSRVEVVYQDCAPFFYDRDIDEDNRQSILRKYDLPSSYILYVGTIEERKNLLSLVKAIHLKKIDLPLVITGKATAYKKVVVRYIEEHSMRNILFIEDAVHEELPAIYSRAVVFVYPSSYEGFGIPVLEALNSGVPVVTSRGSCLEETGGNAALYADPLQIEELGTVLLRVLEDPDLRASMIAKGKEHALNFRPEKTIKKLYQIYRDLEMK